MAGQPISEVQEQLLARLEAARAALSRSAPGAGGRDEVGEVLEELSNSTALLATVKKDLDSIYARLYGMRRTLAAAFPEHAVTPRGGRAALEAEEAEEEARAAARRAQRLAAQRAAAEQQAAAQPADEQQARSEQAQHSAAQQQGRSDQAQHSAAEQLAAEPADAEQAAEVAAPSRDERQASPAEGPG